MTDPLQPDFRVTIPFPGHMAKARRVLSDNIRLADVVLEVTDARAPEAARNPELDELMARRQRLLVLNKADLADPRGNEAWVRRYSGLGLTAIPVDSTSGRGYDSLRRAMSGLTQRRSSTRTGGGQPLRAIVVGIPNVGKSTVINRLVGRGRARTGARPGITRGKQWVRTEFGLELLDLPGIAWPRVGTALESIFLATIGTVAPEHYDVEAVAGWLWEYLVCREPERLTDRFGLAELPADGSQGLVTIGERRGCLRTGGVVDTAAAAELLVREFSTGKIGPITLQWPEVQNGDS
ncbi:MAG: ribosome biogenesis GTPase YlqF [Bacillota bacterium]